MTPAMVGVTVTAASAAGADVAVDMDAGASVAADGAHAPVLRVPMPVWRSWAQLLVPPPLMSTLSRLSPQLIVG